MKTLYTCRGKGGSYEYLGLAKGAGTMRTSKMYEVYRDTETGALFYRTQDDFNKRMVESSQEAIEMIALGVPEDVAQKLVDAGYGKVDYENS